MIESQTVTSLQKQTKTKLIQITALPIPKQIPVFAGQSEIGAILK